VVVTWNSRDDIGPALAALAPELRTGDELIVVDNGSTDGTADAVAAASEGGAAGSSGGEGTVTRLIRNPGNDGFVVAVNQGAREAAGELLVLLNPDAHVRPGWRDGIEHPWHEHPEWGAWQALITSDDGATINSDGNVLHYTGICWAGRAGRAIGLAPESPHEVGYASGACLAVPLDLWREIGGFPERLFMYGDDVDLSLGVRLLGHRVGIEPRARVEHEYEFDKGPAKWRYLERSRGAFLVRNFPTRLLIALAPALAATELAILLAAARGGWLGQKLRADWDLLRWLPALLRERRAIQGGRRITPGEFADHLSSDLDSDFLGGAATSPVVRRLVRAYWRAVRALLRSAGRSGGSGSR